MTSLNKLVEVAGAALAATPADALVEGRLERETELFQLLALRNGFYCFESALHVLPSQGGSMSLEQWNASSLWRDAYAGMTDGLMFFAEDLFGNQFGIQGNHVISFEAETGGIEAIAGSLREWAAKILADYDFLTGHSLGHEWQAVNGRIPPGMRLVPKVPFVLGGQFDVSNLYALDAVQAMHWYGHLALQLRDLPDGATVELKVIP